MSECNLYYFGIYTYTSWRKRNPPHQNITLFAIYTSFNNVILSLMTLRLRERPHSYFVNYNDNGSLIRRSQRVKSCDRWLMTPVQGLYSSSDSLPQKKKTLLLNRCKLERSRLFCFYHVLFFREVNILQGFKLQNNVWHLGKLFINHRMMKTISKSKEMTGN